jgi:hypothetical protein
MNVPERIFIDPTSGNRAWRQMDGDIPYVRADLVPQWIPCSERMPSGAYDNWVLAIGLGWRRARLLNWCDTKEPHWRNENDDRGYFGSDPTHWMPLPQPPKDATK